MHITSISDYPIHQVPFITAASKNGGVTHAILPILIAEVDFLPDGLDAIIATSDLQGIDQQNQRLLGYLVAEELEKLADMGIIPPPEKTGIILAGDFYAQANKRGGVGDVRKVWQAFNRSFRFCVGVGGNHDCFGNTLEEVKVFKNQQGIYYLDDDITCIDGLSIAGISGIIGNKTKTFRRQQNQFITAIHQLIKKLPDILILHEGPNNPEAKLKGNESIRAEILTGNDLLVICGHSHWEVPITALSSSVQVLNVDNRVVVLKR
jgi:3',5'-cyclic-AMP phosphodiesterase